MASVFLFSVAGILGGIFVCALERVWQRARQAEGRAFQNILFYLNHPENPCFYSKILYKRQEILDGPPFELMLYKRQSTANPNMPLAGVLWHNQIKLLKKS